MAGTSSAGMRWQKVVRRFLEVAFSGWLISSIPVALGQDTSLPLPPSESTSDIDSLLNLAEKDVSQLSQVKVSAPALNTEVSTVSRTPSTVGKSPAAVFVITNEMIRRSGAMSIPEALRMAPGLQVARIDANKWAITARGFNSRFANKLLVQIDGRSVYTPLFAGVFWDVQDVLLEDVERIEVIRGPGASVWGVNAVNGVINIITKKAADTRGTYAQVGGGTFERGFANVRQGGQVGQDIDYRVYGKWFDRGTGYLPGETPPDDWRMGRGGFRVDWDPGRTGDDQITFQGDYYDGRAGQRNIFPQLTAPYSAAFDYDTHMAGANALFRWTHKIDDTSEWMLQSYFDNTYRNFTSLAFIERRDTFDIDFQHRFETADIHKIVWGGGFRYTNDTITTANPLVLSFSPTQRHIQMFNYFAQDEISLRDDLLYLTLGCKFVHNTWTNFEYQPTARLLLTPDEYHSLWCAASRAMRIPSRGEEDVLITGAPTILAPFPVFTQTRGNNGLVSEELIAWEAGYRQQVNESFSWDLAAFFNQYRHLIGFMPGVPVFDPTIPPTGGLFAPVSVVNAAHAESYGFELAADYAATENLKFRAAYSFLELFVHQAPGVVASDDEGSSPQHQLYAQGSWNPRANVEIDLIGRYVSDLPALAVPSYFVGDVRLAWRPRDTVEWFVVGRGLFDNGHREYGMDTLTGNIATRVRSEVFGGVTIRR